jgi:hypothetical protein
MASENLFLQTQVSHVEFGLITVYIQLVCKLEGAKKLSLVDANDS